MHVLAHLEMTFPWLMLGLYWFEIAVVVGVILAITWFRYRETGGSLTRYLREHLLHVPFTLYAAFAAVMILAAVDFRIYRVPGRWDDWEMPMLIARFLARTIAMVLLILYDLRVLEMQRQWRRGRG